MNDVIIRAVLELIKENATCPVPDREKIETAPFPD